MISPRRPATTIGELDIHLGFLMEELRTIRTQQDAMMQQLATKQEVADLKKDLDAKILANSTSTLWRRATEIAVGVAAICTAIGFMIAVFKFLKV